MYSLWLDPLFYLSSFGLVASAIMFGYFTRTWRKTASASVPAAGLSAGETGAGGEVAPSGEMSKAAVFLKSVHDDILMFNNRLRNLEHAVSGKTDSHEKEINEVVTNLNLIMSKLENLEPQVQQDIQPQLQSLGMAIESLRSSVPGGVSQPAVEEQEPAAVAEEPSASGGGLPVPDGSGQPAVTEEPAIALDASVSGKSLKEVSVPDESAAVTEEPSASGEGLPVPDGSADAELPAAAQEKSSPDEPPPDPLTGNSKSVYPV